MKDKLMSLAQHQYARNECTIHSQLHHENIVELYDYTESETEFVLLMEYCNDANYFQDKIEDVRIYVLANRVNHVEVDAHNESGEASVVRFRHNQWAGLHTLVGRHT